MLDSLMFMHVVTLIHSHTPRPGKILGQESPSSPVVVTGERGDDGGGGVEEDDGSWGGGETWLEGTIDVSWGGAFKE